MLIYINRRDYWNCEDANIIFHPVSITRSHKGASLFNSNIKKQFPQVYDEYQEFLEFVPMNKLLGEIQLIQIDESRFIMNAYVYIGDKINHKALTKALIEMSNLLEEYHINGSLLSTFGTKEKEEYKDIEMIYKTILKDNTQDVFIYNKKK